MATDVRSSARHGMSRRRVLAGTAWAAPAVLVGLAAPPAAASNGEPPSPGALSLVGATASKQDTYVWVLIFPVPAALYSFSAQVAYAGNPDQADVTDLRLFVEIAEARAPWSGLTVSPSSTGWNYVGATTVGQLRRLEFAYDTSLGAPSDVSTELRFSWTGPRAGSAPEAVTFQASGQSASVAVQSGIVTDPDLDT